MSGLTAKQRGSGRRVRKGTKKNKRTRGGRKPSNKSGLTLEKIISMTKKKLASLRKRLPKQGLWGKPLRGGSTQMGGWGSYRPRYDPEEFSL